MDRNKHCLSPIFFFLLLDDDGNNLEDFSKIIIVEVKYNNKSTHYYYLIYLAIHSVTPNIIYHKIYVKLFEGLESPLNQKGLYNMPPQH